MDVCVYMYIFGVVSGYWILEIEGNLSTQLLSGHHSLLDHGVSISQSFLLNVSEYAHTIFLYYLVQKFYIRCRYVYIKVFTRKVSVDLRPSECILD